MTMSFGLFFYIFSVLLLPPVGIFPSSLITVGVGLSFMGMSEALGTIPSVENFVNILTHYDCDFDIVDQRYVIDAKSIMGLFSLDLTHPLDLKIYSEDEAVVKSVIESLDDFNYVVK